MAAQDTARKLSDSVYLTLISRLSMVALMPVLGVTIWLALNWLDNRFDGVAVPLKKVEIRVDTLETRDRATELVIQNHTLRLGNSEQNGASIATELGKVAEKVGDINTNLTKLNATLAERDRRVLLQP